MRKKLGEKGGAENEAETEKTTREEGFLSTTPSALLPHGAELQPRAVE